MNEDDKYVGGIGEVSDDFHRLARMAYPAFRVGPEAEGLRQPCIVTRVEARAWISQANYE